MLAFSPHARQGKLQPGGTIIEATGGNTGQLTTPRSSHISAPLTRLMVVVSGVALALGAKSGGFKTLFTMPDWSVHRHHRISATRVIRKSWPRPA